METKNKNEETGCIEGIRVGNFLISDMDEYIEVGDINGAEVVRLSKVLSVARLVSEAVQGKNEQFLEMYATMLYYVNGIVPDVEFWQDMSKACVACLERHPDFYGMEKDGDTLAEAEAIASEKEIYDFINSDLSALDGDEEDDIDIKDSGRKTVAS